MAPALNNYNQSPKKFPNIFTVFIKPVLNGHPYMTHIITLVVYLISEFHFVSDCDICKTCSPPLRMIAKVPLVAINYDSKVPQSFCLIIILLYHCWSVTIPCPVYAM